MPLDLAIPRSPSAVQSAVMQFAARRSLRLSQPGHIDGQCIEDASLPTPARVEVLVRPDGVQSIVSLAFGDNPESVQLAYALQRYLADDRAYACECPPICPQCNATVANVTAKFCGRCGAGLVVVVREPSKLTIAN
ncbi:MAG: hypothetical protein AABZ08_01470 [Planctomycetota bacterium]